MKIAYADPPYVGQSAKHYGGAEVNHRLLIAHLCDEFPDGWALSASSPSLRDLLPLCPVDVRIGAWVKTFASFKPGVNPAYAWEPVIFRGGRTRRHRDEDTVRDWCASRATQEGGFIGAKPDVFCIWVFAMLGLQADDDLVDLFPGSGAVAAVWESYRRQAWLPFAATSQATSATMAGLF
jgi:hypothetical protein